MKTHTQSPILSTLQSIHDDAAHALGTEAEPQDRLSVARQDLEVIREAARDAIEEEEKRAKAFAALLAALKTLERAHTRLLSSESGGVGPDDDEKIIRAGETARAAIALAEDRAS